MTRAPRLWHGCAMPSPADTALERLLSRLEALGYAFVTPTPATHACVLARPGRETARDLRDALGWSLPFAAGSLDPEIEALLAEANMLAERDGLCRSRIRVSSLRGRIFIHSAYPTSEADAVFFGPDSYRFADLVAAELGNAQPAPARIIDIGAGAGVGAIVAGGLCSGADLTMTDINARALRFAAINARAAGIEIAARHGRDLAGAQGPFDIALANPPYMIDSAARAYRDGGAMLGALVSLDIARAAAAALAPGGRLILYTGSAIVDGEDRLRAGLEDIAARAGLALRYRELDPDVFGEELGTAAYAEVDRIAAVAAILDCAL